MTKDLVLALESENWPVEKLKPVKFVCANKPSFRFWLIEGTVIAGHNLVFAEKDVMVGMVYENLIFRTDEDGEPTDWSVEDLDELGSVITENGDELFYGDMELDEDYVKYENEEDDPGK